MREQNTAQWAGRYELWVANLSPSMQMRTRWKWPCVIWAYIYHWLLGGKGIIVKDTIKYREWRW